MRNQLTDLRVLCARVRVVLGSVRDQAFAGIAPLSQGPRIDT